MYPALLTALERKFRQIKTIYVSIPVLTVLTADRGCIAVIAEASAGTGKDPTYVPTAKATPCYVILSHPQRAEQGCRTTNLQ